MQSTLLSSLGFSSNSPVTIPPSTQTSYPASQSPATPPSGSEDTPTSPAIPSPNLSSPSGIYAQVPSTPTLANSTVSQVAALSTSSICTSSTLDKETPFSAATPKTITSLSFPAASPTGPAPDSTSANNSSSGTYTGNPNSPLDGDSVTDIPPRAKDSPYTGDVDSPDVGDQITDIPDSATQSVPDDSTATTFETNSFTSTVASASAAAAPYPLSKASSVLVSSNVASTGGVGTGLVKAKATGSPLPYSTGAGCRGSVGSAMAIVAGTMAGFWLVL